MRSIDNKSILDCIAWGSLFFWPWHCEIFGSCQRFFFCYVSEKFIVRYVIQVISNCQPSAQIFNNMRARARDSHASNKSHRTANELRLVGRVKYKHWILSQSKTLNCTMKFAQQTTDHRHFQLIALTIFITLNNQATATCCLNWFILILDLY